MLNTIVYVVGFAAALSVVATSLDQLAARRGKPRRLVWLLAMLCSTLMPPLLIFNAEPEPAFTHVAAESELLQPETIAPANAIPALQLAPAFVASSEAALPPASDGWHLAEPSSNTLLMTWALVSGGLFAFLFVAGVRLWRQAARWQRAVIQQQEVLVSEDTGPALLGMLRPRIVVPRWFMDEPAATQSLILEHEQQHVAAHDPLLLRVATLMAIVTPWNLPLWWQLHRLRLAIELDCDARVMRGGAEADRYGKVLLEVTQRATVMPVGVIAMSEPVSALENRIRSLQPDSGRYATLRVISALLIAAAGVGAAAALEAPALQPAANNPVRDAVPGTPATRPAGPAAGTSQAMPGATSPNAAVPAPGSSANPVSVESNPAPTTKPATGQTITMDSVIDDRVNADGTLVNAQPFGKMVTNDATATYGSGAMAGVVNMVLNNRLVGFKLDMDYGVDQSRPWSANLPAFAAKQATPANPMELRALIKLASDTYGWKFIADPRVQGAVDLGIIDPDDPDSLSYHVFLEILGAHGFIAVNSQDVVTIVPSEFARTVASPVVRTDAFMGDDAEVVTALIQIGTRGLSNPQLLAKSLSPLVSRWGHLSEAADGKSLLMVDKVANVKRIAELVRQQTEAE